MIKTVGVFQTQHLNILPQAATVFYFHLQNIVFPIMDPRAWQTVNLINCVPV